MSKVWSGILESSWAWQREHWPKEFWCQLIKTRQYSGIYRNHTFDIPEDNDQVFDQKQLCHIFLTSKYWRNYEHDN